MNRAIILIIAFMFLLALPVFVNAIAPTHSNPTLQEVLGNLTGTNSSGSDADNDVIVFNYKWYHKNILNATRWINDSSLIANLPLDANTIDFARSNDATAFGDASQADGIINKGYQFDGTGDYLQLAADGTANFSVQNYTIEMWAYFIDTSGAKMWSYDFTSHNPPYYAQQFRVDTLDSLYLGWNNVGSFASLTTGANVITANRWYHIVAQHGTGSQKIFVNGEEKASGASPDLITYYAQEVWVGNANYGATTSAIYDEIKFYSRMLTPAEINQSYRGTRDKYAQINVSRYTGISGDYRIEMTPYDTYESGTPLNNTVPDTTPPNITYYNLTSSDNGCENWNTDKSNACSISDPTPVVQFNTNKNAWCAIAGSSSSTSLNLNYTNMGSSRNCTGAASGEGTKSHLCTLTNQDELVYDTSYIFISCKDSSNNQNLTSTSGALKVSVTSLETDGRNSIGLGIQNALLNSYTNYTDLQIYARNLSNAHVKGTFDRAAKKGSKLWAFNGIGVADSHVNMFNLTPVLYTLEFANTTSSQITLQVELLINATK